MENMQLGAEGLGEEDRVMHRLRFADIGPGGFPVARFVLAFGFQLVGAVGHDLAVFRVDAQRQLRLRDVVESFDAHAVVGEGQVADGFAEENLVTDGAGGGHGQNIFGVGLHDDAGDAEVDQRFGFAQFFLDLNLLGVRRGRHGIGHVDDGGDAAADRRGGAGVEILFVGHAGFAEVDMAVE